ncbi:hypothetical protein CB1_000734001 [Camelus ferus]|nr:hypothetical protein CB1_000734001 [Camelus ferus]
MPEDDGMAAHKAVEQQTIPIAKVSITTTLNSYCSVLAAAILVSGCLEEMKRVDNNFMLTILPHFDMIFIVKALSKVKLQPFNTEADTEESLRLFQVSTLATALLGTLSEVEGFSSQVDRELLSHMEKQLKHLLAIGSQVLEHNILQDLEQKILWSRPSTRSCSS